MKQPEDTKTLDLLEPAKRGRGRPRLENALTPAERAKRYRDKKREAGIKVTPENVTANNEIMVPVDQLIAEQGRSDVLRSICEMFVDYKASKKAMPRDIFRNIQTTLLKV